MRTVKHFFATCRSLVRNETRPAPHLSPFALLAIGLLVFSCGPTYAQAGNTSDILQEISSATARVAKEATPAVVGIWVDIRTGAEQTSMQESRDDRLPRREGQNFVSLPS